LRLRVVRCIVSARANPHYRAFSARANPRYRARAHPSQHRGDVRQYL